MLKGIIFDADGVLIDSMRFHVDSWKKVFYEVGIEITSEDIYLLEGNNDIGIIKNIFGRTGKEPELKQIEYLAKKKNEIFKFDQVEPFKGTLDCLKVLKRYFKLAVVSGSSRSMVEKAVNKFFPDIFAVIITGDETKLGKPYPDPYLKALEELELTKDECIVVENSPYGIIAAKSAKIYCVAVASTLKPEKLQNADIVFEDHTALFEYLNNLTIRSNRK